MYIYRERDFFVCICICMCTFMYMYVYVYVYVYLYIYVYASVCVRICICMVSRTLVITHFPYVHVYLRRYSTQNKLGSRVLQRRTKEEYRLCCKSLMALSALLRRGSRDTRDRDRSRGARDGGSRGPEGGNRRDRRRSEQSAMYRTVPSYPVRSRIGSSCTVHHSKS